MIPLTVRLEHTCTCSRFVSGIAGSNRVEGTDSCILFVVCCVGGGLSDELITRIEESYRLCTYLCVRVSNFVCDLENSTLRRLRPQWGCCTTETKIRKKIPFPYTRLLSDTPHKRITTFH